MTRVIAAVIAALALTAPVLISLGTRVHATETRPLPLPSGPPHVVPTEVPLRPGAPQNAVHEIHLQSNALPAIAAHSRIRLAVANYATSPRLDHGELTFTGTSCRFRTPAGEDIVDNSLLTFAQDGGCSPLAGTPTGLVLTLTLSHPGQVALWTHTGQDAATLPADALTIAEPALQHAGPLVVSGDFREEHPEASATRVSLLASMWEMSASPAWIVALVCACGLLAAAAVLIAWRTNPMSRGRHAISAALGIFLFALAISVSYVVIFPPFQAADEPNHFLALTAYLQRPDLAAESASWASRMAFQEIRFNPGRSFSPLDRGRSGAAWQGIGVPDDVRGAGMRIVWAAAAPVARRLAVQPLFLAMRLLHALIFAIAVALFVALVAAFTDAAAPLLLAVPLLLVPTLPYFGMHVSNYAPLLSAYVLLAAGVVIAVWDGDRSYAAGAIVGWMLAAAIAFSRSSLPILPFVAALLAARAVLGDRAARAWTALMFWVGCAATLAGGLALVEGKYLDGLQSGSTEVSRSAAVLGFALRHPWTAIVPLGIGLAIELLTGRWRSRQATTAVSNSAAWVRWAAIVLAVATLAALGASLWVAYPTLDAFDPNHRPPALDYVRRATLACVTFLRFGRPDNLTSITFFGGFGWLETLAPEALVSTLAGASGLALALLFGWIARVRSGRALAWVAAAAVGFVLSAAAYALTIIKVMPADLHGRYLLGLYVCFLAVCWSGLARVADGRKRAGVFVTIAAACCLAVNAYCLTFILARYF